MGKINDRRGHDHKLRVLAVKEILEQESGRDHPLAMREILARLCLPDSEPNRRNVRNDIAALVESGMSIEKIGRCRGTKYYVAARVFQPGELKMLVDIVQSSHSIDERTSRNLVESLLGLDSTIDASAQRAAIRLGNRPKTPNEQVFRNIEVIQQAMARRHTVSFHYYDIGYDREEHERYLDGEAREETPIVLTYVNDCYYLISWRERGITTRRLDRMKNVLDTGNRAESNDGIGHFDLDSFARTQFGMFIGEPEWVTLRIDRDFAMNALYDHYGTSDEMQLVPPHDGKPARASIKAVDSKQFRGWIMGLGDGVTIIDGSPDLMRFAGALERMHASSGGC